MKADQADMTRRLILTSPRAATALLLLTLGACGQAAAPSDDSNAQGGSNAGIGGTGSPTGGLGGTAPLGGSTATGGVSGAATTGGASGSGLGGTAPGGADAGGAGGSAATGGAAGSPGGATTGGSAGAPTGGTGAGAGGAAGGGSGAAGTGGSAGAPACPLRPVGWAALPGAGFNAPTSGGCNAAPVTATNLSQLQTALTGFSNKVVRLQGNVTGTITVNANTTLEGVNGARITGAVVIDSAVNVILRNLTIVGNNCDDADPCEDGADAVS